MSGPFNSEQEARAAAHRVVSPEPGWSILRTAGNRELLRRALDDAGVTTGAYDDRIAEWMGQWEDALVAVVAGWITRAAAGRSTEADGLVDDMKPLLCKQMVRIGPEPYDTVRCGRPIDHEADPSCPGNPHARPAPEVTR